METTKENRQYRELPGFLDGFRFFALGLALGILLISNFKHYVRIISTAKNVYRKAFCRLKVNNVTDDALNRLLFSRRMPNALCQ